MRASLMALVGAASVVAATATGASAQVLNLPTITYDASVHYQQVRDSWGGLRTPDGH